MLPSSFSSLSIVLLLCRKDVEGVEEESDEDTSESLGFLSSKKNKKKLSASPGRRRRSKEDAGEADDFGQEPSPEALEAFEELLETQKSRKVMRKKQIEERAKAFIPSLPEEVQGQRGELRIGR